jgi:adenylate kinase family enzyme
MPANAVLIIGEAGSGKSTSVEKLPPQETFIINVSAKPLPFKGWRKNYTEYNASNPNGNILNTDNAEIIIKTLEYISGKRPEVKYIVIDDSQYVAANEYMRRAKEVGFGKFTEIAQNMQRQVLALRTLRSDLYVFFLSHLETLQDAEGNVRMKAKTIGKMMDNVITYEGMFAIVLFTDVQETKDGLDYGFITNGDPKSTAKSPRGMFLHKKIPNDLLAVVEAMKAYED